MNRSRLSPARRAALVVAAVLALAACSSGDDDSAGGTGTTVASDTTAPGTPPQLDTIKAGTLTACTDIPNAPFGFEEDGQVVGIDPEIVRAIGGHLGLAAEFVDTDFDGIFAALQAGRCDIIASSVPITEESQKTLAFSEGYFEINQSLLVRKADEATYPDLASLKGRSLGVQSSTTGADYAEANAEGANIKEFTGADDMFTALKAAQIDGIVQDYPVNAYHATTTGETVVVKTFTEADKEQYGIVMPKGKDELKKAIDGALAQIKADDSYPTILRRYLGDTTGAP